MNKTQNGFAVIESILILVIIAVISGIGWYAYNSKNKTDKILSQADKISQSTPVKSSGGSNKSNSPNQKYLVIKEWSVEVPLTPDITDATYSAINGSSNSSDEFGISTTTLSNLDPSCSASSNGVGYFFRQTVAAHDTNATKNDEINYPVYSTKIGNYYYQFVRTQAACSSKDSINQKQMSYFQPFIDAFSGIKAT